jgi:hypothetical protein
LIADYNNHRVRQLVLESNEVTTFAGSGQNAYVDGSGSSTAVSFQGPIGVTVDRAGTAVYVLSSNPAAGWQFTSMVRKITSLTNCPSGMYSVNATTCAPCPAVGVFCPAGAHLRVNWVALRWTVFLYVFSTGRVFLHAQVLFCLLNCRIRPYVCAFAVSFGVCCMCCVYVCVGLCV